MLKKMPEWEVKLKINLKTAGNGTSNFYENFYVKAPGDWQARRNAKAQAKAKYKKNLVEAKDINCKRYN